jgi:hypothetical protein
VAFLVVSSQYLFGGTEEKSLKPKQNTMWLGINSNSERFEYEPLHRDVG